MEMAMPLGGQVDGGGKQRIFLIRHGNSTFNAWRDRQLRSLWRCSFCCETWVDHDSPLSPKGAAQVAALRDEVRRRGLHDLAELIVVSPLVRALDTALGGFGGGSEAASSSTSSSPSLSPTCAAVLGAEVAGGRRPPPSFVAHPAVAERLEQACDLGTPKSALVPRYPGVDFDLVAEEHWWHGGADNAVEVGQPHLREPSDACARRAEALATFLLSRPERCIVVVGHSNFFRMMTGSTLKLANCGIVEVQLREVGAAAAGATGGRVADVVVGKSPPPPTASSPLLPVELGSQLLPGREGPCKE
mmetsp:Transcript_131693/g.421486  ORF Transcript_131693/g.421486 Transcript_131693/m.421486 type:complete len:303 (-) Transcript_131693:82-990(-)